MTKKTEASLALELKLPEPPADERIAPAKAKTQKGKLASAEGGKLEVTKKKH